MEIRRLSLAEGAQNASGAAVIIDVFRAFTCEPLMFYSGARRVLLEGDPAACLAYREHEPDAVLVGEVNEEPIDGFDLTNSPTLILERGPALFADRTVVHRTTSGVTGALTALERCEHVFLGSFVNARATVEQLRQSNPAVVSIVAMGIRSTAKAPEDEACGDYIESLLTGRPYDHVRAMANILAHETAQKFLRGDKIYLPREDPSFCLQRDLFAYALRAERSELGVEAVPTAPIP